MIIDRQNLSLQRKRLREENKKWPATLLRISEDKWPKWRPSYTVESVWRSRYFAVSVSLHPSPGVVYRRIMVNRAELDSNGGWKEGITWDELMEIKRQCGYGDFFAVEVYPADGAIVNVANMRHLVILPEPPPYAWRPGGRNHYFDPGAEALPETSAPNAAPSEPSLIIIP